MSPQLFDSGKFAGRQVLQRGKIFRYSVIVTAVALSLSGLNVFAKTDASLPEASPLTLEQPAVIVPSGFSTLIQSVKPAVVNITVEAERGNKHNPAMPDLPVPGNPHFKDFLERYFKKAPGHGDKSEREFNVRGVGSGFIVSEDGFIVTNSHVIDNAARIQVVLNDGRRLPAKVHGRDPKTDLALLKIDADESLPYVVFGNSDTAQTGDWVVAIGNPFGLGGTATTGIISARGRDINSGPYDDYLQIDAPINRGNSGGPLFDLNGRVIGVNTAIYSPTGANVGIGFAVPATQAKAVIAQLMDHGRVERGWLGVQIQALDDALAESVELPNDKGALVAAVTAASPAQNGGIQVGDVILSFDGREIDEMRDLPRLVADFKPGQEAKVTVWRQGKRHKLKVTIAALKEDTLASLENPAEPGPRLGLALAPISDELRRKMAVAEGVQGALVVEVEPGSPAAQQGLRPGDVVVQADRKLVSQPRDLVDIIQAQSVGDRVLLLINRQGSQRFVTVELS